jgi:hypothetical protein
MFWIFSTSSLVSPAPVPHSSKSFQFKEIPTLPVYGGSGSQVFWENFPFNDLPKKPETRVNHVNLGLAVKETLPHLLKSEVNRAKRCLEYLQNGGPSFQIEKL